MAESYGYDISLPAVNTKEAIQWLYFGYLAAVKEQNGAAMSLGRTSTFLDIYAERDLKNGVFTEEELQEMVDHFIMKLRLIKFARTPEYNALFSGDPQWVTESIGGVGVDGRHMVTKMSYRYLHTLKNLGAAPEPNLTVLWSVHLPESFKRLLAGVYVNTLNVIHYMHDKYCYEKIQMALHDRNVTRWFATGIAGLSVVADSLSAIKYAKVKVIRDENGIAVDYEVEGDFPKYGNDDDRVDEIAREIVHIFMEHVRKNHTYRGGIPTTSILTITSNVVYGKATGSTPDGRKRGKHLLREQTRCTKEILMVRSHPWHLLPSCRLSMLRTVFPIRFLLFRERLERTIRYSQEILKLIWTVAAALVDHRRCLRD